MHRWLPLFALLALLGCGERDALAPTPALTPDPEAAGSGIVIRMRPGRFLCGLPADDQGRTCRFIPEEGS